MNVVWIILGIIVGIIVLFVGLQLSLVYMMRRKEGKPMPELDGKIAKLLRKGERGLFYFHSPSCRACLTTTPIITEMARRNKRVFSVDISKDMAIARKFGVMATPATVLVEGGVVQKILIGPQPAETIKGLI